MYATYNIPAPCAPDTQKLVTMDKIEGDCDIVLEQDWDHIDVD